MVSLSAINVTGTLVLIIFASPPTACAEELVATLEEEDGKVAG
jgi:hypothetical protein